MTLSSTALISLNLPLISAFLARATAQFLKLFAAWYKEKRFDRKRMLVSSGMLSLHSVRVTALPVAIALQDGTSVLACVVMYDASGVRLHAGRQAELLNQLRVNILYPILDLCLFGHTLLQEI